MSAPPEYEVFAIRYATRGARRAEAFIDPDPHDGPLPMDYYVWVARSAEATVVIDTGFSREVGERRGRTFLRCPVESLSLLGIRPAEVAHVIVTHLHNDHAGNLGLFPAARFHLQDREMAFATGRYMRHACCGRAYELDHVLEAVKLNYGGRIDFHDGADEILPGLSVHPGSGHTPGLQFVRVWTRSGWLVLASDTAHYYENFSAARPFRLVFHVGDALDTFRSLMKLAGDADRIVPGHDPLVMERYPSAEESMKGIVARLD
jgi:glyoxylase-like metal-dependent hydrolase (beta-lactamase superfamily II)